MCKRSLLGQLTLIACCKDEVVKDNTFLWISEQNYLIYFIDSSKGSINQSQGLFSAPVRLTEELPLLESSTEEKSNII